MFSKFVGILAVFFLINNCMKASDNDQSQRMHSGFSNNDSTNAQVNTCQTVNIQNNAISPRSIAKTFIWRVVTSCITVTVTYWATGSIGKAFAVGSIDNALKIPAYYAYEQVWNQIGRCRNVNKSHKS